MGHAAGEGADGVHPLRAQKLLFQGFFLGDVAVDQEQSARLACVIAEERPPAVHGDDLAGARLQLQFAVPLALPQRGGAGFFRGGGRGGKDFRR